MIDNGDDCAKRRLTDKAELRLAAEFLLTHGVPGEDIALQLCRHYYVDVDVLNEVLTTMPNRDGKGNGEGDYRRVA